MAEKLKPGRKSIDAAVLARIADLMINHGMQGQPQKVSDQLCEDYRFSMSEEDKLELLGWDTAAEDFVCDHSIHVKKPTVEKYMKAIREHKIDVSKYLEFRWPRDIGNGDDQIPADRERFALDCVNHYLEEFGTRPMIGLVQRFAQVAFCSPGWNDPSRATSAEILFYADLVGSVENRNYPSTEYEELRITTKGWEDSSRFEELAASLGIEQLTIPASKDEHLIRFMPTFWATYNTTPAVVRNWERRGL